MPKTAVILVVDDEAAIRRGLSKALAGDGRDVITAADLAAARAVLAERSPDAVLLDLKLPDGSGFELLEQLRRERPRLPVVILTAYGDVRSAVKAMRGGAWDFLEKPFEVDVVLFTLERALEHNRLRDEVHRLRERLDAVEPLGDSPAWKAVLETARRVAPTRATVLIKGESGTGKEVLARHLHELSGRSGDFVPVHAAALPAELLESELFGHARGAFSGAVRAKAGLFEAAAGGTLFLDEVGELPPAVQVKLLRVLQEGVITRLGETQPRDVDLRLVAATNRDLAAAVAAGDFREDLFYRLAVLEVDLPPLRERTGDIALMTAHFLKRAAAEYGVEPKRLTPEAERLLNAHPWPGNVRELNNLCQRLVLLASGTEITPSDLPPAFQSVEDDLAWPPPPPAILDFNAAVERLERRLLERALAESDGVAQEAARRLGLGRGAIQYKLKKYGLGG